MGSSPIGSRAAESWIFSVKSSFSPFLFSPRKGCEEETFWSSESALDYYGYTDRTPDAWHLAVDIEKKQETADGLAVPGMTRIVSRM